MNKIHLWKAFKISLAATGAILLAGFLHLEYAVTAGIITVLSIQNTKRETFKIARNRALAFACALIIAILCYYFLGFRTVAFAVYLFIFAWICLSSHWSEAIAMDSVLISHFLSKQSLDADMLVNEILLFVIGTGFGILANLHLHKQEKEFDILSQQVDEQIKQILHHMSEVIQQEDKQHYNSDCFRKLEDKITLTKECALRNMNNTFLEATQGELDYIKMRENQSRVLQNIYQSIIMLKDTPSQAATVARFISHIEENYHRDNNCRELINELREIFSQMKQEKLPASREEFESRAVLFYLLRQLEEFLRLKNEFVNH